MPINIPNQEGTLGIPSQYSETISNPLGPLFLSSHPDPLSMDHLVEASQTLAAFTVVGLNASGRLVAATATGSPAVKPIGVLAHPVTSPAGTNYVGAKVYRAGHFNHKRLVWDSTFNTDALKINAFEGAPTPTQIRIGTPRTYTP